MSSGASSGITPAEYVFWVDANTNDAVETSEVAASKLDGISEGGADPTNSDLANLGFTLNNTPSSGTSLITIRGLPDILSLNKGAKTSTGDWLLTENDLEYVAQSTFSGVKILDNSGNFSGNFSLSLWTTTTVGAESAVSTSSKIIIDVAPVADNPNLKVRATVPGEEDAGRDANGNIVSNISESKPIPLPFRFELGDKSETISINVKLLDASDAPISGAELVTVDQSNGAITSLGEISTSGIDATTNLTSLFIVPPKDFSGQLKAKILPTVTDGSVVTAFSEETIIYL